MTPGESNELQRVSNEARFQVARDRLNFSIGLAESIDTKLVNVFSVATIILPVTAGLLSRSPSEFGAISDTVKWMLTVATAAYAALFVSFILGYKVTKLEDQPQMGILRDGVGDYTDAQLYKHLGDVCIDSYLANLEKNQGKTKCLTISLVFLAFEVGGLMLAVRSLLFS